MERSKCRVTEFVEGPQFGSRVCHKGSLGDALNVSENGRHNKIRRPEPWLEQAIAAMGDLKGLVMDALVVAKMLR